MKKALVLLFTFIGSICSYSQSIYSGNTKGDLLLIQSVLNENKGIPTEFLETQFPIYNINGEYYLSVLCKVSNEFNSNALSNSGIIFGSKIKDIVSLKLPVSNLNQALTFPGLVYLELGNKVRSMLDKAVKDTRADSVQYGLNLPQSYTGKDVLIGVTDWGFDYTHPMFYDTLLNESRVLAAWDQYKTSGPAPSGFTYGTEYATPTDLLNANSDTINIYSSATHGSHVAGIAGGSGGGTVYRGVGFDAQFLFATFLVDDASVLDAYAWMYQKSQAESKRLVINQSWGLHYIGTLDGNSLLSQAIDNYSDLGVVFCTSGGNNGDVNFHIKHTFTGDLMKSRVSFNSYSSPASMWGESLHMWGEPGESFSSGIMVLNSSSVLQNESPLYSTLTTSSYVDTFLVVGNDTIRYNISADNIHPLNNRPQMRLRVKCTNTSLKIVLKSTAPSGTVHYWNVVELSNGVGNWGEPFSSLGTGYIGGDANYGIGEPACTQSVITVAAYSSAYYNTGGTLIGGTIAGFSSYGPTLDDRVKPDISAPGVNVGSSINSYTDNGYTLLTSVDFNGRTYPFARFSGTSMSGPMVTGIVSLILEANPNLSAAQVKQIIIQTARTDNQTGVIPVDGSLRWGWGKIHAYNAVKLALETQGLNEMAKEFDLVLYPNPTSKMLTISHSSADQIHEVELITIDGKSSKLQTESNGVVNVAHLQPGMYFLRLTLEGKTVQVSFVKD